MSKENLLKDWKDKFLNSEQSDLGGTDYYLNDEANEVNLIAFLSHAIDQTREETIREIRKHDEEELIKIVNKLKLDVVTRIAFKNLKPESVGYNKCALKVQIKIKQIKQLIKYYYAK